MNTELNLFHRQHGKLHKVEKLKRGYSVELIDFTHVLKLSRWQLEKPVINSADKIPLSNLPNESGTGFYIVTGQLVYAVEFCSHSKSECEDYTRLYPNTGIIATDAEGYHYVATLNKIH